MSSLAVSGHLDVLQQHPVLGLLVGDEGVEVQQRLRLQRVQEPGHGLHGVHLLAQSQAWPGEWRTVTIGLDLTWF